MRVASHQRYYAGLVGRWRGVARFELIDRATLRDVPSALDRMRIRIMAWFSPWTMDTTLELLSDDEARHTTRLSKFGMPVFFGEERITLLPDGASFTMTGWHRLAPTSTRRVLAPSSGHVDADASGATYPITWMGTSLLQRTRIVPDGLELTQTTSASRLNVVLHRLR